jgi:hypothetical protein
LKYFEVHSVQEKEFLGSGSTYSNPIDMVILPNRRC